MIGGSLFLRAADCIPQSKGLLCNGCHSAYRSASDGIDQFSGLYAGESTGATGTGHRLLGAAPDAQRIVRGDHSHQRIATTGTAGATGPRSDRAASGPCRGTGDALADCLGREHHRRAKAQSARQRSLSRGRCADGTSRRSVRRTDCAGRVVGARLRQLLVLGTGLQHRARIALARPCATGGDLHPAAGVARCDHRACQRYTGYRDPRFAARNICGPARQAVADHDYGDDHRPCRHQSHVAEPRSGYGYAQAVSDPAGRGSCTDRAGRGTLRSFHRRPESAVARALSGRSVLAGIRCRWSGDYEYRKDARADGDQPAARPTDKRTRQ